MRERIKNFVGDVATGRIESLIALNPLPSGLVEKYSQLVRDGSKPILCGDHESHSDGFALALAIENLQEIQPIKGFVLPVASSFVNGSQNKWLARAYSLTRGSLARRGLHTVPYTRDVDVKNYEAIKDSRELREWVRLVGEGYSFAILPEASVQGGRHATDNSIDDINGIKEIEDDNILSFYDLLTRHGRSAFFLPIGIHGTYRIMSPNNYRPHSSVYPTLLGLSSRKIAEVSVGMPITVDNLGTDWRNNKRVFNRFIMGRVAQLIPEHARGIYRNIPAEISD